MLRAAVLSLPRKDKRYVDDKDAAIALPWLKIVFELKPTQTELELNDLIDLAFAVAQTKDKEAGKYLKEVGDRLEIGIFKNADKLKGYYWLANACRVEEESENEAFKYFGRAFQLGATDKDDLAKKAAKEAAEHALQLARKNLKVQNWVPAIEKSGISEDFAYKLKEMDLETAAELNGEAVRIRADAVFDKSSIGKKGKEKYRVFEQALKTNSGFFVPVVVAELEFAWEIGFFPKEKYEDTIKRGNDALKWALSEEKSRKPMEEWWKKWRCKGMVKLADVQFLLLTRENKEKNVPMILKLYEDARALGKYTEKYNGELPYKIGGAYMLLDDKKRARPELIEASEKLNSIRLADFPALRQEIH
jgi:hypothetical protein